MEETGQSRNGSASNQASIWAGSLWTALAHLLPYAYTVLLLVLTYLLATLAIERLQDQRDNHTLLGFLTLGSGSFAIASLVHYFFNLAEACGKYHGEVQAVWRKARACADPSSGFPLPELRALLNAFVKKTYKATLSTVISFAVFSASANQATTLLREELAAPPAQLPGLAINSLIIQHPPAAAAPPDPNSPVREVVSSRPRIPLFFQPACVTAAIFDGRGSAARLREATITMGVKPEDSAAACHTLARDQAVASVERLSNYNRFIAEQVIDALAPCAEDSESPVLLRVYGFASSQPIRRDANNNFAAWESNLLNVEIANRRTTTATRYLRELAGDSNIRIEPAARYDNLAQMQCQRRFNDRPDGAQRTCEDTENVGESATDKALEQDFFTRTAHIELVSAGACQTRVTATGGRG